MLAASRLSDTAFRCVVKLSRRVSLSKSDIVVSCWLVKAWISASKLACSVVNRLISPAVWRISDVTSESFSWLSCRSRRKFSVSVLTCDWLLFTSEMSVLICVFFSWIVTSDASYASFSSVSLSITACSSDALESAKRLSKSCLLSKSASSFRLYSWLCRRAASPFWRKSVKVVVKLVFWCCNSCKSFSNPRTVWSKTATFCVKSSISTLAKVVEFFLFAPPEKEPPGRISVPSSATILAVKFSALAICVAWSLLSTIRTLPSKFEMAGAIFSS